MIQATNARLKKWRDSIWCRPLNTDGTLIPVL